MASGKLALFDLDLTLIPFDSGMAWTQFLIGRGILPAEAEGRYLAYCHEYIAGTLDIHAMHRANMQPLLEYSRATLTQWQQDFKREMAPRMPAWALALVKRHQDNGDHCAIVTATTELISEPIARLFDIDQLVATRPATVDGLAGAPFTGEIDGEPCYRQHKVTRVHDWLASQPQGSRRSLAAFEQSWFYSDAIGDLPLLNAVSHPVAVCPDERLRGHALKSGWPILDP